MFQGRADHQLDLVLDVLGRTRLAEDVRSSISYGACELANFLVMITSIRLLLRTFGRASTSGFGHPARSAWCGLRRWVARSPRAGRAGDQSQCLELHLNVPPA